MAFRDHGIEIMGVLSYISVTSQVVPLLPLGGAKSIHRGGIRCGPEGEGLP
jgi:hypothetical protein